MTKSTLPILLLAAGAARRMRGADKLLEEVDGQPLLRRQAAQARAATAGPVIVTLPPRPHGRYAALSDLDVTALPVPNAAEGMGLSIAAGIKALPEESPAVLIVLADLPDLTAEDFTSVLEAIDLYPNSRVWRGTTSQDKPGHPIAFHASVFPQLEALTGDDGGRRIVAENKDRVTLVPLPGNRALNDLDTPEDWARWRAHRQEIGG